MRRLLIAMFVSAGALLLGGAMRWTGQGPYTINGISDGGTEVCPTSGTDGISLVGMKGFSVHVYGLLADGGYGATLSVGSLLACLYDPATGRWARAPDLDLTTAAIDSQGFAGFIVTSNRGRIAYVPSGVGVPVRIQMNGVP